MALSIVSIGHACIFNQVPIDINYFPNTPL